jgi:beta-lactamase regulating signal transducer with metallopeptidase domain
MIIDLVVPVFLRAQLAASLAVLVVIALRAPMRRLVGAEAAYGLWVLPLVAALVSLFPTLHEFLHGDAARPATALVRPGAWTDWTAVQRHSVSLATIWIAGAAAWAALTALAEWRFHRLVILRRAGPAVVGVAWPRMVAPADYRTRFTQQERAFIREHERTHMARGDTRTNLMIAVLRAASWFNPLAHLAASCCRLDQELACDALVAERHPHGRRPYAEALMKAHAPGWGQLACAWAPVVGHPWS